MADIAYPGILYLLNFFAVVKKEENNMLNFLKKKKKQEQPDYYQVVQDLQNATQETFNAYRRSNEELETIRNLYEDKMKDLELFQGLSNISLELLSTKDFAEVMGNCLRILLNSTTYDHCGIYMNTIDQNYSNVLFGQFKNRAFLDDALVYLDFKKRSDWYKKLSKGQCICGNDISNLDQENQFVNHGIKSIHVSPIFTNSHWWGCLLLTSFEEIEPSSNELKAIKTISNMFGESIKKNDLLRESAVIQGRFHDFSSYILDNLDSVAFWMKDYKDRYLFLNDALLKILFPGMTKEQCIGKTNPEITSDSLPLELSFENIKEPSDLPKLDIENIHYDHVFNLTDQLTRHFGFPCKFLEITNEQVLEVWKSPIFRNNDDDQYCCAGTVGALIDVTDQKQQKFDYISKLEKNGQAHRIGNTVNYYLIRVDSPTIFLD